MRSVAGLAGVSAGRRLRVSAIFIPRAKEITPIERTQTRVNEQIRLSPIRVIAEDGEQLGVIPTEDALKRARDANLDLVEVAPNERPPVCRIMDYGKYKYQKSKKQQKKASHQVKTKEIRLRPKTGQHDIDTKVNRAIDFLKHKDKVQITVLFRGRELAHDEEGRKVAEDVIAALQEHGKVESPPKRQGRRITAVVAPK